MDERLEEIVSRFPSVSSADRGGSRGRFGHFLLNQDGGSPGSDRTGPVELVQPPLLTDSELVVRRVHEHVQPLHHLLLLLLLLLSLLEGQVDEEGNRRPFEAVATSHQRHSEEMSPGRNVTDRDCRPLRLWLLQDARASPSAGCLLCPYAVVLLTPPHHGCEEGLRPAPLRRSAGHASTCSAAVAPCGVGQSPRRPHRVEHPWRPPETNATGHPAAVSDLECSCSVLWLWWLWCRRDIIAHVSVQACERYAPNNGSHAPVDMTPGPVPAWRAPKTNTGLTGSRRDADVKPASESARCLRSPCETDNTTQLHELVTFQYPYH